MNSDEITSTRAVPIPQIGGSQTTKSRGLGSTENKQWRPQNLALQQQLSATMDASSPPDGHITPNPVVTDTVHPHDVKDVLTRSVGASTVPFARRSSPLLKFSTSPGSTRRPILKKTVGRGRPVMAARKTSAVHLTESHSEDSFSDEIQPASSTYNLKTVAGE